MVAVLDGVRDELAGRQSEVVDDAGIGRHAVEPIGNEATRGGDVLEGRLQLDLEWNHGISEGFCVDQDMTIGQGVPLKLTSANRAGPPGSDVAGIRASPRCLRWCSGQSGHRRLHVVSGGLERCLGAVADTELRDTTDGRTS